MKKNRKSDFLAWTTFSCGLVFASTCSAQVIVNSVPLDAHVGYGTVIQQPIPTTPTKHLGNGPIDMNNLSAEILNCEVCRQRLGLPPLSRKTVQGVPSNQVISPNGLTTSRMAKPVGQSERSPKGSPDVVGDSHRRSH